MTILIVDDDLQFLVDALLEIDPQIQGITAYNGIEALKLLDNVETKPDFIFYSWTSICRGWMESSVLNT